MHKVIINALQYKQNSSGIGVLLRDLFGPFTALTRRPCRVVLSQDAPEFPAAGAELAHCPWDHQQGLRRMFYQTFQLRRECKDSILLTTDSKTPFFLPESCFLIPLITDLAVFRMPEVYQPSRVLWWRLQYRYLRRRADLFLTISEFTKRELIELLDVPAEQIFVVPCACSPRLQRVGNTAVLSEVRKKYGLDKPFVLFVGNSNPRKNLTRIMRAFDRLKEETSLPHQLIIAGEQGWQFDREAALAGLRHGENVRFIGFVPDEDMSALYSAASLFAFPTLYEGFGIPVLEAQSCGTPVLTSSCSSLPEVGGDGAWYVDPRDENAISKGMEKLLTDRETAQKLIETGYENAMRFSWRVSAERLAQIIEEDVRA